MCWGSHPKGRKGDDVFEVQADGTIVNIFDGGGNPVLLNDWVDVLSGDSILSDDPWIIRIRPCALLEALLRIEETS